jgi:hypothetical protein
MGKVVCSISVSPGGFIAPPNDGPGDDLGDDLALRDLKRSFADDAFAHRGRQALGHHRSGLANRLARADDPANRSHSLVCRAGNRMAGDRHAGPETAG